MPTAPHGKFEDVVRRVSNAYRDGRIVSGLKRRAKDALKSVAKLIESHPRLKRATLWGLKFIPPLDRRVRAVFDAAPRRSRKKSKFAGRVDLSPGASNVFVRLMRQQDSRTVDADRR